MKLDYKQLLPVKKLPIIIIGAGGIVNDAHLPAYKKAGFHVAGITNRTKEKAAKLADKYSIAEVFDSVEQAVRSAPENCIYDITLMPDQFIDTLRQLPDRSFVMIQKPFGDNFNQTLGISKLCKEKKLKAAVNCQLRYAPFVLAAKDMISRGSIGEVYDMEVRLTTHTPWEIFPNVQHHERLEIQQHSIHYIDLIRSFLGDPKGVMAKTLRNPVKAHSSTRSTIIFDYGDTMHAVINTNHDHKFGSHNQESFIKWEGTKGCIKARMGLLLNYPVGVPDLFEYCIPDGNEARWKTVQIEDSWFPDAFIGTMSSLMRYANGESLELPTSIDDVIKSMALVEAAYESHYHGSTKWNKYLI